MANRDHMSDILGRLFCVGVLVATVCVGWIAEARGGEYLIWDGGDPTSPNVWDESAANWTGDDTTFAEGDVVNFTEDGTGLVEVDSGGVTAGGMYISGSQDYTFSGGSITSDTLFLGYKNFDGTPDDWKIFTGTADFTALGTNEFTNGVTLGSGGLRISNIHQLGTTLSNLSFEGWGDDGEDLGAIIDAIENNAGITDINELIDDARASGELPTLYIAGDITINNESDNSNYLAVMGPYEAASIHLESGVTMTYSNNTRTSYLDAGIILNTGTLVMTAGEGAEYVFSDNKSNSGGGTGVLHNSGHLVLTNATFTNNTGGHSAGAMNNSNGFAVLANVEFTDNKTTYNDADGGAIWNDESLSLTNAVFKENVAGDNGNSDHKNRGGAIYNATGDLTLTNVDFLGNRSYGGYYGGNPNTGGGGGAIYSWAGTIDLNVTSGTSYFAGNTEEGSASANSIAFSGTDSLSVDVAAAAEDTAAATLDMRDPMRGDIGSITKTGGGVWNLGGDNVFGDIEHDDGDTAFTVLEGTLHLYRESELADDAEHIDYGNVSTGNLEFAGETSVFTVDSGATLSIGGGNSITAASGDISINNTSDTTLRFDMTDATEGDARLTLSGTLISDISSQTVDIVKSGDLDNGTYLLVTGGTGIDYDDNHTLTVDGETLDSAADRAHSKYSLGNPDTSSLALTIGDMAAGLTLTWTNDDAEEDNQGIWANYEDGDSPHNWTDVPDGTATITQFHNGDDVIFDSDYATIDDDREITVHEDGVSAGSVDFKNEDDWSFSGGAIKADELVLDESFVGVVDFTGFGDMEDTPNVFGRVVMNAGGLKIDHAGQLGTDLENLSFKGETSDLTDLQTAIASGDNDDIHAEIDATRASGELPTLYIADDITFDGEEEDKHRLNIASGDAGSIHVESGILTIENNHSAVNPGGGALRISGGLAVLTAEDGAGYVFSNNLTTDQNGGGAISNSVGTLVMENVTFTENSANVGGAIRNTGTLLITNGVFEGNIASNVAGGAISSSISGASNILTDVSFLGNSATTNGGAIALTDASISLNTVAGDAIFAGNKAAGAANSIAFLHNNPSTATITTADGTTLDMRDPMFDSAGRTTIEKLGDGAWKLGGTNNLTGGNGSSTLTVSAGTLHLYRADELDDDDQYVLEYGENVETGAIAIKDFIVVSGATLSIGGGNSITTSDEIDIDNTDATTLRFDMTMTDDLTEDDARLTLTGTLVNDIGGQTVDVLNIGDLDEGTYTLISGGDSGDYSVSSATANLKIDGVAFATATAADRGVTRIGLDDNEGVSLDLVIGEDIASGLTLTWTNADDEEDNQGIWANYEDGDSPHNWSDVPDGTATITQFNNGDDVIFDSTYAAAATDRKITIDDAGVETGTVNFVNDGDWKFSGGEIAGDSLTKDSTSTGTVTLNVDAEFSEDVAVDAGTLAVGAGNTLTVEGELSLAAGATLGLDVGSAPAVTAGIFTNAVDSIINITGYSDPTDLPVTVLVADNDIDRNYTITVGGVELPLDVTIDTYLTLEEDFTEDNEITLVNTALVWNNNKDKDAGENDETAHGTFNITDDNAFTVGVVLENNESAEGDAGYDGWNGDALTKTGTGTLILTAENTYDGGTTVVGGTLQIGSGDETGSIVGDVEIDEDATLAFNRSDEITFDGDISGGGSLVQKGDGVLVLEGENDYAGGTTIEAGTLRAGDLGAVGSGDVDVESGGVFELAFNSAPAIDDVAAFLSGNVNLNGGGFNLSVDDSYTIDEDLSFANADAGSVFTLDSSGHTVTLADGVDITAGDADFAIGVGTTLLVGGDSSTITAANTVIDGTLDLPASSSLTVDGDAILSADGVINVGATTDLDIGTLHVTGELTIEASSAGDGVNIFFGSEGNQYRDQPFIFADGGIDGFDNLVSNFFELVGDGNGVYAGGMKTHEEILGGILGGGVTPNLRAGATATDANRDSLPSDLQDRIDDYVLLLDAPGVSPATVSAAFRELYGEYAVYARRALREDALRFQHAMRRRVDNRRSGARLASALPAAVGAVGTGTALASPSGELGRCRSFADAVWAGAFGGFADQGSRHGVAGYEYKSAGVVLGYDHVVRDDLAFGFAGAYSRGRTDVDDLRARYRSDAVNLGAYAAWFGRSGLYARAAAGFGYGWNDYRVNPHVGGGEKEGDYHTLALTASAEFGREWELFRGAYFIPSLGVDFAWVRNGGWAESARGGAVANRFESGRDIVVDIPLTARVGKVWDLGGGRYIMPEASVSWVYSAGDRDEKITATYVGAPFTYNQRGIGVGRGRLRVGATVRARLSDRSDVSLDYAFETRTGYRNHNLSVAVGWSF